MAGPQPAVWIAWNSSSGVDGWTGAILSPYRSRCGVVRCDICRGGTGPGCANSITCALPSCPKTFQEHPAARLAPPAFHRLPLPCLPSLLPSPASLFATRRLLTTHHSRRHLPWTQPQQFVAQTRNAFILLPLLPHLHQRSSLLRTPSSSYLLDARSSFSLPSIRPLPIPSFLPPTIGRS